MLPRHLYIGALDTGDPQQHFRQTCLAVISVDALIAFLTVQIGKVSSHGISSYFGSAGYRKNHG